MPAFSLNDRKNRVTKVTVELPHDGGSFDLWYRASVVTPAFLREMDATEKNYEKTVAMIVRMAQRWGIYAEVDGQTGAGIGLPLPVLIVVNRDANELARVTLEGEVVWSRRDPGLFNRPTDAAVASNGDIYVSDGYGNALVHHLNREGRRLRTWGMAGSGPGQFRLPHGVCVARRDGREAVYVCDRENRRIQVFTLDGEYLAEVTGLARPTDIVVDTAGLRYITELEHRVTVLDPDDRVVTRLGAQAAAEPGRFVAPHACWLDSAGSLYVTEVLEGRRAQKFRRV